MLGMQDAIPSASKSLVSVFYIFMSSIFILTQITGFLAENNQGQYKFDSNIGKYCVKTTVSLLVPIGGVVYD